MKRIFLLSMAFAAASCTVGCKKETYADTNKFAEHYVVGELKKRAGDTFSKWGWKGFKVKSVVLSPTIFPGVEGVDCNVDLIPEDDAVFYKVDCDSVVFHRINRPYGLSAHADVEQFIKAVEENAPVPMNKEKGPFTIEVTGARRINAEGVFEPVNINSMISDELWRVKSGGGYLIPTGRFFVAESVFKNRKNCYVKGSAELAAAQNVHSQRVERINAQLKVLAQADSAVSKFDRSDMKALVENLQKREVNPLQRECEKLEREYNGMKYEYGRELSGMERSAQRMEHGIKALKGTLARMEQAPAKKSRGANRRCGNATPEEVKAKLAETESEYAKLKQEMEDCKKKWNERLEKKMSELDAKKVQIKAKSDWVDSEGEKEIDKSIKTAKECLEKAKKDLMSM